jgi:hypothetical protein
METNQNLIQQKVLLANNADKLKKTNNKLVLIVEKLQNEIINQDNKDICQKKIQDLIKILNKLKTENINLLSDNQDLNDTIQDLKNVYHISIESKEAPVVPDKTVFTLLDEKPTPTGNDINFAEILAQLNKNLVGNYSQETLLPAFSLNYVA